MRGRGSAEAEEFLSSLTDRNKTKGGKGGGRDQTPSSRKIRPFSRVITKECKALYKANLYRDPLISSYLR